MPPANTAIADSKQSKSTKRTHRGLFRLCIVCDRCQSASSVCSRCQKQLSQRPNGSPSVWISVHVNHACTVCFTVFHRSHACYREISSGRQIAHRASNSTCANHPRSLESWHSSCPVTCFAHCTCSHFRCCIIGCPCATCGEATLACSSLHRCGAAHRLNYCSSNHQTASQWREFGRAAGEAPPGFVTSACLNFSAVVCRIR